MTRTIEPVAPLALPSPGRLGQGTAVEMSRAVAEVHAAAYAAYQFPRNEGAALAAMENSCRRQDVAETAFYRMPRTGGPVTGPTVHLAKELARCWGHIQHGITELRRDAEAGESEMQAFAWDVQTGTRTSHTFIVPHKRDKTVDDRTLPVDLETLQSIYENNANNGARRLRECIFGVLPSWFAKRAQQLCRETLNRGDGTPIEKRVETCIAHFAELGVTEDMLVRKLDLPRIRWTGHEVSHLGNIYSSLKRNEVTVADEFATARATAAEITGSTAPASGTAPEQPAAPAPAEPEPAPEPPTSELAAEPVTDDVPPTDEPPAPDPNGDKPAAQTQLKALHATLHNDFKLTDRDAKLDTVSKLVGARLASSSDLTRREAATILNYLSELRQTQDDPARALDQALMERELPQTDGGA